MQELGPLIDTKLSTGNEAPPVESVGPYGIPMPLNIVQVKPVRFTLRKAIKLSLGKHPRAYFDKTGIARAPNPT